MAYLRIIHSGNNKQKRAARSLPEAGVNGGIQTGTVKWFNEMKGFGFIVPSDGSADVFVHVAAVQKSGLHALHEGQRVEYELIRGRNGKTSAENLKVISL